MKPLLAAIAFTAWAAAQPAWLAPYPGATAQTRNSPGLVESTYEVAARPAAVAAHYQKLFESAGLPFNPSFDGIGTVVRASASECDLLLKIREQAAGSSVRVSCAAKTPALTAVPTPAPAARPVSPTTEERIAQGREHTRQVLEEAEQKTRKRDLGMAKFDQPSIPKPEPPIAWPSWLVGPDGAPLPTNEFANTLNSTFSTTSDQAAIHAFYLDLLTSHGCRVTSQTKYYMQCATIRIDLTPVKGVIQVHVRVERP